MRSSIEQMDQAFIALAWRLWNTLGVAGESPQYQDCFIDLEALILLTTALGKSDPRLLEEALDWCSKFHHFVSISRLRRLLGELTELQASFSAFAQTLNAVSKSKWPTFTKAAPLRIHLRGRSQHPDLKIPALLGLRLRALFGVGARADLATFFLTEQSRSMTASDVTEVGYNKRTLADTLDSFYQAGLLTCSMTRNQKEYQLARKGPLASLAGELPRFVPNWRSLIVVFLNLREVLSKHQSHSTPSQIVAIRNVFISLKNPLEKLNISPPPISSDPTQWNSFIQWTVDTLKGLVNEGSFKKGETMEELCASLIARLYKVDDCTDGLEFIISHATQQPTQHQKIFKECYQMGTCYLEELQSRLQELLQFPIHLFMDLKLAELVYQYSQEQMPPFLRFVQNIPPSTDISLPGVALNWYKRLETELTKIHQLTHQIKQRIRELYFRATNIHLLNQSTVLHKRHTVLKLFSE